MKFEVLKRSHLKRNIIIGIVVIVILSAIVFIFTSAKIKNTQSIPLANGTINYSLADLNIVAIIVDGEEMDQVPDGNYELTEESYCTVNGEKDSGIKLSYDSVVKSLSVTPMTTKGTKCYLYFQNANFYHWNRYQLNKITTYLWNRYDVDSEIDYYSTTYGGSGSITNSNGFRKIYVHQKTTAPNFDSDTGRVSSPLTSGNLNGIEVGHWFTTSVYGKTAYQYSSDGENGTIIYYSQSISSSPHYTYSQGSYLDQVTSQVSSSYPNNGRSGNYWYVYQSSDTSYSRGDFIAIVTSKEENAYPDNNYSGDYWYVKIT